MSPAVCAQCISACVPRLEGDILDAPSYPCPRQFLMSKFDCGRVSSIELAIASPAILCRLWNPKNSSRMLPPLSTKRMTSDSCSLFETSVTSSASIEKMEHQMGFESLCFLVFALIIY